MRKTAVSDFPTEKPIRVLQVLDKIVPDSGVAAVVMRYLAAIDRKKVVFDIMVHSELDDFTKEQLNKFGARYYRAPSLNFFNLFRYIRFLFKFFSRHPEYKIVHGHIPNAAIFYLSMARLMGVPSRIIHSHSTQSADNSLKRLRNFILNLFIPLCANVYCACSKAAAKFLFGTKAGRVKSPYYLIHNALPLEKYVYHAETRRRVRQQLNIREDQFVVGHIGRFCRLKNHSFVIDVFAQLHKSDSRALLMLVGEGELKEKILLKVKNLNLRESVVYLGVREDIPELLQAMDLLLFPSLKEGLPLVVVEAQCCGLPCLVSRSVTNEVRLVPRLVQFMSLRSSPESWAEALRRYKNSPMRTSDVQVLSQAGYDIKQEAKRLVRFYTELYLGQPNYDKR